MEGRSLEPHDPSRLRISDDDRHKVAEVLRTAAGDGRIDLDELDERLEQTYAAKTYADLVPITADLPVQATGHAVAPAPRPRTPSAPGPRYPSSFAVMSETKRQGSWSVAEQHTAAAVMGSVLLDMREATFEAREVTVVANVIMGEVKVVVDPHTVVILEGVPIMGEFKQDRDRAAHQPTPDSPVVRVKGFALMGSVRVQRKPLPGSSRRRGITGRP
jgi:hypothetical protein